MPQMPAGSQSIPGSRRRLTKYLDPPLTVPAFTRTPMYTTRMIPSILAMACVCVVLCTLPHAHARAAQGYGSRMQRILTSLRTAGGVGEAAGVVGAAGGVAGVMGESVHALEKRQIYDTSCKGVYDRGLFSDLEHVCDDCYNLYRNSHVASACRARCFGTKIFDICVKKLLLQNPEELFMIRDAVSG